MDLARWYDLKGVLAVFSHPWKSRCGLMKVRQVTVGNVALVH